MAPHSPFGRNALNPWRLVWTLLALWMLGLGSVAQAQGIESIMAPGKLIQGHAKYEDDCKQCHVKLDRKAQDGLCMDCHKEVKADVKGKMGYHGRIEETVCRNCHTEHKGRDAKVIELDTAKFDHNKTDYALHGKHEKVTCVKCHVSNKKYREAASDCVSCHKKDDTHKGSLGSKCADCHTEKDWKEAKFDHDTTKFPLTGKHVDTKCVDCHKTKDYKETPKACFACHKKNDEQKGHKGQFGEKCETCHNAKAWKPSTFKHDVDTKYVLKGKHVDVKCTACHTTQLYKEKTSQECVACHKKDDKHKESLGKKCETCHTEKNWKEIAKFDHAKSDFPLLGKHAKVECKECHKSQMFKEAPKDCYSCHQKDDKHKDNLGKQCESCHNEQNWKDTKAKFDHGKTKFPLRNGHAKPEVKCESCHKDLTRMRNTALDCVSCHKKDDKHEGQLGTKCESCHNDKLWKEAKYDHALSRFPLTGRHLIADCKKCHETLRYKDAPRDCFSCHKKEDKHKQVFGMQCETCHSTRSWATWSFNHDTQTKFRLDGSHVKVACEACHKQVAPAGKPAAPLSSTCVSCHRAVDAHNGTFGNRCELCHRTDSWKKFKGRVGAAPAGLQNQLGNHRGYTTWAS